MIEMPLHALGCRIKPLGNCIQIRGGKPVPRNGQHPS